MEENKKEKVDYGAVSWRIGPERKNLLTKEFGSPSSIVASDRVMDVYFKDYPELQEKYNELQKQYEELQEKRDDDFGSELKTARETIENLQKQIEQLTNQCNQTSLDLTNQTLNNDKLQAEIATLRKDDPSLISIRVENDIVRKFLDAVQESLQARYNRDVSFYEIFVMSTLLYNVEKRCDWFYPPLSDNKIKEITGKDVKQWKQFFKKKEE